MKTTLQLKEFGLKLLEYDSFDAGLTYISSVAKEIIQAQRCSLFIYNVIEDRLWTPIADGREQIEIPYDLGIVGQTIRVNRPILENEPYGNVNFLADVDIRSGYYTQNLLTSPIRNDKKEVVGVIQLLNKEDGFRNQDMETLLEMTLFINRFFALRYKP